MYRFLMATVLIIPLSGCGTTLGVRWDSYRDQHRQPAHTINCSGHGNTWEHCRKKATKRCGTQEYIVISLTGDGGVTVSARKSHRVSKAKKNRSMKFRCR